MNIFNKFYFFFICCTVLSSISFSTVQAAPVNDNFADAILITGETGTISGNNVDATKENATLVYPNAGTPECRSIWYEWTPPVSGTYYFNTFGTTLDTVLAVYTGTAIDSLTYVNDNDDFPSPTRSQSRLSFLADVSKTYRIVVDSYTFGGVCISETPHGYTELNWGPSTSLPANNDFTSSTTITGSSGTTSGTSFTTINATPEVNEPNHITSPPSLAYSSIWFDWTAPSSGQFIFDTFGSDYDTTMAVYTGGAIDSLTPIAENDDSSFGNDQSRVSFTATASTTYRIVVDGFEGLQGNVILNWNLLPGQAVNDDFTNATSISGKYGTTTAFNFFATKETGEPYHADNTGPYASIWFKWTAPFTRNVIIDTFGSDYDTTLAAYTGSAVNNLKKLAENDDDEDREGTQSIITFPVVYGATYYIAVDGFEGAEGNVVLNWQMKSPWVLFNPAITGGARP